MNPLVFEEFLKYARAICVVAASFGFEINFTEEQLHAFFMVIGLIYAAFLLIEGGLKRKHQ